MRMETLLFNGIKKLIALIPRHITDQGDKPAEDGNTKWQLENL
jgi:hypothetical protein